MLIWKINYRSPCRYVLLKGCFFDSNPNVIRMYDCLNIEPNENLHSNLRLKPVQKENNYKLQRILVFSDGIMIVRYLFKDSFPGELLTEGAVTDARSRSTEEIAEYLQVHYISIV